MITVDDAPGRRAPAHVRTFRSRARALISAQSDLLRSAARIAADRPRALTAEALLLGLRRGFAAGFDVAVG